MRPRHLVDSSIRARARLALAGLAAALCFALGAAVQFKPPTEQERTAALGQTDGLPETLRRALAPDDDFDPIPAPGPSDWLASHREDGQTFDEFVRSHPNRPDQVRFRLYLQPLGEFATDQGLSLDRLQQFAAAYFMMDVRVLPALNLTGSNITTRRNPYTGNTQLRTGDILTLLRRHLPEDAFALLGITTIDLYPDDAWNFVFGQASLTDRVGVYSFARYDPRVPGQPPPPDSSALMLRRSCKVLAHETAHMFGIQHCVYFRCLVNGSNHLAESDSRPLHECPVDLRKLQHSIGFDVVARYRRLYEFAQDAGFADEARRLKARVARIAPP